ncbi:hypothetical protein [Bradyrhizobium sp. CCBAU 53380]|uniref:hypothetical protein n=1 Tax=Bradyrhizobium sp. CCBAU 53380 TaxID=1325117 RepID=UPI0023049D7B|nr:hypothetical protein [Bradyrhizobium sp. CCBAU 53380]
MDTYSKAFEEALAAFPQTLLVAMIKKKLEAQGIRVSEKKLRSLVRTLLEGERPDSDSFLDRIKKKLGFAVEAVVIAFTDEDHRAIEKALEAYVDELPRTVEDMVEQSSMELLNTLKKDWRGASKKLKRERSAFEKRLHERWGDGLSLLGMLIAVAREVGSEIQTSGRKAANAPPLVGCADKTARPRLPNC